MVLMLILAAFTGAPNTKFNHSKGGVMIGQSKGVTVITFVALFIIAMQLSGFCFLDPSVDWLLILTYTTAHKNRYVI